MFKILIVTTPNFNISATMAFVDPFRAANYLEGSARFRWTVASAKSNCLASNGVSIETRRLEEIDEEAFDIVVVSSSWTPEAAATPHLKASLRKWARSGSIMAAIDTGAFILAEAGLLSGRKATVHYEHIDAFKELFGNIEVSENIFIEDGKCITCSGGLAASDMALHIISAVVGASLANSASRYIFHPQMRPAGTSQSHSSPASTGHLVPESVKQAIAIMEQHLENVLPLEEVSLRVGVSQRQLERLFSRHVGRSPVIYYRDIRLDRARGLLTQTAMLIAEIAVASGFASPMHFSRAYRQRFGLTPRRDRVAGRIPYEFRPWPMHSPAGVKVSK